MFLKDVQRERVYDWEKSLGLYAPQCALPTKIAQAFIGRVWQDHAPNRIQNIPPTLTLGNYINPWAQGREAIHSAPSFLTNWVLLHEIAHGLVYNRRLFWILPAHGSIYMRIYITLLEKYLDMDGNRLEQQAKAARIKIASRAAVRSLGIRV